ncbi:MAG: hypothetical protein ACUVWR_13900 [Anaerolineae bacterium]
MSQESFDFVARAADQTLADWGLSYAVSGQAIASRVADGTAYWEQSLPDGHLGLIRLFSPVVRREEVFLGNVLLNDFLSKTLTWAVEGNSFGRIVLLANDLENYYYLYHGRAGVDQLAEHFRQEILTSLPDLYFGDENVSKGIHGDVGRMLTFQLANREPHPVFAVPSAMLPALLKAVNLYLRSLDPDSLDIQNTVAILSFFYARGARKVEKLDKKTGKYVQRSVSEMQSDFAFLVGAAEDGLLPYDSLREAFAVGRDENFNEQLYRDRKGTGTVDRTKFLTAIWAFLDNIEARIACEGVEPTLTALCEKALNIAPEVLVDSLLSEVQLGFQRFGHADTDGLPCRFCGASGSVVREKTILCGTGMTRFFNPAAKLPHPKAPGRESLCIRCGISSYLETKFLGMMFAHYMPIPRQYNLIFHYGRHDEEGTRRLATMSDKLFDLLRDFQQKAREEKAFFSVEYIREQMAHRAEEHPFGKGEIPGAEEALAALFADDVMTPGLEIMSHMTDDRAQVLPLGVGDYRLLAFILPQLRPGRDEALNFVQRRFSKSRLTAFTLLALLRRLCGCDGPYYFHSVPTLSLDGFDSNTFYVQGRAENADEAIQHYGAIANFARRVVKYQEGHSLLAYWIILAERLEEDPLGTFSDVLRDSPLRGGDDLQEARYRRLSNEFVKGMGVIDGTEYLRLIEQLRQL